MGLGSGGNMRALGGRVQFKPSIFEGRGEGKVSANESNVRDINIFERYFGEGENIGGTKETLSKEKLRERDKLGLQGKAMFDLINKRYASHKNDIMQIGWDIANDGRDVTKGNASLNDINTLMRENKKQFDKLFQGLQSSNKGTVTKSINGITNVLATFLGKVTMRTRGEILSESHNSLRGIRDKHIEIKDYIKKGQWNKVASFKVTKETQWAKSYVTAAKNLMKDAKSTKNGIIPRNNKKSFTPAVQAKIDRLNSWRNSGSSKSLSLSKIGSNISRLNKQMRETQLIARRNGVPLNTTSRDNITKYQAQKTQYLRNLVKNTIKQTGVTGLTQQKVLNILKSETQKYRGRQA